MESVAGGVQQESLFLVRSNFQVSSSPFTPSSISLELFIPAVFVARYVPYVWPSQLAVPSCVRASVRASYVGLFLSRSHALTVPSHIASPMTAAYIDLALPCV
jgi:hypothetical protein